MLPESDISYYTRRDRWKEIIEKEKEAEMTETAEQALERVYAHLCHLKDTAEIQKNRCITSLIDWCATPEQARANLKDISSYTASFNYYEGEIRAYDNAINEITRQRSYLEKARSGL